MTDSSFPMRPLADFCRVQSGFAFKSADWVPSGVPVVQIGNVRARRVDLADCKFVSEDVAKAARKFRLRRNDILISMTGHIGVVGKITDARHIVLNQRVGRFEDIDADIVDPSYLFQVLQHGSIRQKFVQLGHGAAQPNISPKLIGMVEVPVPPLDIQRSIAAILGGYDHLIEVNRRRIALLEDMARGLYEEWFVRFRFPGHENVAMVHTKVGSLPEGWHAVTMASVADINARSLRLANAPERIGYIDIASVSPGQVDEVTWMAFSDAPNRARRCVREASILWSNVRPNRRSFAYLVGPAKAIVASTGFTVIDATSLPPSYLYSCVTTDAFVAYLVGRARGSAYPAVTAQDFSDALIVVPPKAILTAFDALASTSLLMAASLRSANCALAASRDFLLPRLISGQISVRAAERELLKAA